MLMVENYYEILKIKGVWTSTTPRDEQVLALAAEIAALKAERLGLKPPKKVRDPSNNTLLRRPSRPVATSRLLIPVPDTVNLPPA
jgi:hypothetical protein